MQLIALSSVKAHVVSDDGGQVAVAFATNDGTDLSVMISVDNLDLLISALNRAKSEASRKRSKAPDQMSVKMPKQWMVTDLNTHGLVLLIFDPKTDAQVGYALNTETCREMAAGLVKLADAVTAHKENKKSESGWP